MADVGDSLLAGTCDLCGRPYDALAEDCHTLECSARCVEGPQLYHTACLAKHIRRASRSESTYQCRIPHSHFSCPRGAGKGSSLAAACKGVALKCNAFVIKKQKKEKKAAAPPPPVLVPRGPKPKQPGGAAAPKKPPPQQQQAPIVRRPPVVEGPKPDPLGRNADAAAAAAGKAAKKNAKRAAAKRREAAGASDAASELTSAVSMGSSTDLAGADAAASASQGDGDGSGAGSDAAALLGSGRFISSLAAYQRLLGYSSDSEQPSEEEAPASHSGTPTAGQRGGQQPPPLLPLGPAAGAPAAAAAPPLPPGPAAGTPAAAVTPAAALPTPVLTPMPGPVPVPVPAPVPLPAPQQPQPHPQPQPASWAPPWQAAQAQPGQAARASAAEPAGPPAPSPGGGDASDEEELEEMLALLTAGT